MYYIIENNKILLFDTDKQRLINTLEFMPQYQNLEVLETNRPIIDGVFADTPEYKAEQIQERSQEFNKQFFNTSLGYIRRKVTMANGEIKDFLTDLLPSIAMGVQFQKPVTVITYKEPDFTEEITDWTKYQEIKQVTSQFIDECFEQLNNDFVGN